MMVVEVISFSVVELITEAVENASLASEVVNSDIELLLSRFVWTIVVPTSAHWYVLIRNSSSYTYSILSNT